MPSISMERNVRINAQRFVFRLIGGIILISTTGTASQACGDLVRSANKKAAICEAGNPQQKLKRVGCDIIFVFGQRSSIGRATHS